MSRAEYYREWKRKNREHVNAYSREYRKKLLEADPEGYRKFMCEAQKRYRRKLRKQVLEKLGNKCAWCEIDDVRVLQIDHIHGGGRQEWLKLKYLKLLRKIRDDPDAYKNYQILCANCNWIKRIEQKEVSANYWKKKGKG